MGTKSLPLDKTAVIEFKLSVVDTVRRSRYLAETLAAKLPRDTPFQSGDYSVTNAQFLTLTGITTMVIIYSFDPITLDITKGAQTITGIPCSGLFILTGAITQIVVKSPTVGVESRVAYAHA